MQTPAQSAISGATVQHTCWETTYTTANWDYPSSPAAYYNALLSRGASHSRFLRIAYSSTRDQSTLLSTPLDTSTRKQTLSRSCARSTNPPSHILKRRKPQWPKPPHYHASLLRSPLSHRKGLFRAVLAPNKAVDFFRWDVLFGAGVSSNPTRTDPCASLHVAECVLEPYEAAAGFFGWHGLGLDVIRRVQTDDGASDLRPDVDEAAVDEGRARWARVAEELVGPPGLVLRWIVDKGKSDTPLGRAHPWRREEVRWDPDIGYSPCRPSRPTSAADEKRRPTPSSSMASVSGSRSEFKTDSPPALWYGPCPAPHLHSHHFPPLPPPHYAPPLHYAPYGGRVTSAQGHGYWYVQSNGAPPVNRDLNPVKSHVPHSHTLPSPITAASVHPSQSPRHPTKPTLDRNGYRPGHERDKEAEIDHGYESTTTTTDSDPPPHTPIGAATTSALHANGDNDVEVHGIEIDADHAAASVSYDPATSAKLLDRFAMSTSPSVSSDFPDPDRAGHGPSKATVVYPSLNGSFRQGPLSQMSASPSSQGIPCQMTPSRMVPSSPVFPKKLAPLGHDEDDAKMPPRNEDLESSTSSVSAENPALTLSLCSPPPTSPGSALRKDSQGFWEPVTSLSPSEGKGGSRPSVGWIGDKRGKGPGSTEAASSQSTLTAKARSLSPSPRRVTGLGCTRSSSSGPASIPTSMSMSVLGGSYPSSPSPPSHTTLEPPNPTTLLPAFLATASVKRKKTSRTREIVDRLRSSSIDAGKSDVGLDDLGWVASPSGCGELDGKTSGSDRAAEQASPSSPTKSSSDLKPRSDTGKNHDQDSGSKSSEANSSEGGKANGATVSSETVSSPSAGSASAKPSITPFPILSVSQPLVSDFKTNYQRQGGVTTAAPSNGGDRPKMNAIVPTSPSARIPSLPSGGIPAVHPPHRPLPSPTHPTGHPHAQPALPPPPIVAVPSYPPPMYVPFTQYRIAPPHQGQQAQGWVAIYPSRPPPLPVHPLPAPSITGASGMRHVSW